MPLIQTISCHTHGGRNVAGSSRPDTSRSWMPVGLLVLVIVTSAAGCASGRMSSLEATKFGPSRGDTEKTNRGCEPGDWSPPRILEGIHLDIDKPCWIRSAVIGALEAASATLENSDDCRAMFTELGANGLEVLRRTRYIVANPRAEIEICKRAWAFTTIGGRWTGICRDFARLDELEAATVILHEALHQAGLSEWTQDRRADKSIDITNDVRRRCGLGSGP